MRLVRWSCFFFALLIGAAHAGPLRTVAQVKQLSFEEARREPEAAVTGVVTHITPEWWGFTLQDATGAVYVHWSDQVRTLAIGRTVSVTGKAFAGNFAPSVEASTVTLVGGGKMPAPAPLTWEQFATGACDNRYVELAGIVRSVRQTAPAEWNWPALLLRIDVGGNVLRAYVRDSGPPPERLIDSHLRARGICVVGSNSKRQFTGNTISVSSRSDLLIDQPGPVDPFDAPFRPLRALFGYNADGRAATRTRVAGVATAVTPDGVYLQEGADGMLARAPGVAGIRPGDRLEAVGYPSAGDLSAVLDDAVVRVAGRDVEPSAVPVEASKVLQSVQGAPAAPDAVLVRISGTVLDWTSTAQDEALLLEDGGLMFLARLPRAANRRLGGFADGSRVAVTGVCVVHRKDAVSPRSFEVILRSSEDVTLVRRPPLSRGAVLRGMGVLLVVLAASAVWLAMLRRRVARQTATIRAQFRREADLRVRYADLVENASDPMYIRDMEGRFLEVNRGTAELTGYTREELLAMTTLDLVVPEERERARANLSRMDEQLGGAHEYRIRTKQGKDVVVEIKGRVLHEDGQPARVECIGRDVTARHEAHSASLSERRQLQEQLHQSQKMESIGLLAGGVAHDFNNLLTVISGYAQMARDEVGPEHPASGSIDEIAQAADRAAGLTRQLLTFSRRRMSAPKVLSLNELIVNLQKMLGRLIGEDILLHLSLNARTGMTRADAGHLEQVVMNLAVNARDAMPGGGRLSIETRDVEAGTEDGAARGKYVELLVADTGVGMPAEVRDRIFEPFFTTKEKGKGTGLGLSTVYGIVRQSGGEISVRSEPGRGATFRILLPSVDATVPDEAPRDPVSYAASGNETILVAEDEDGVRRYVSSVLRANGYTVLEAGNGREALEVADRHSGSIELLLSDVVMPELGGVDLAERFEAARPGAAVVMMSGYADRPLPPERAATMLTKPFTPAALLSRVRQALRERRQRL